MTENGNNGKVRVTLAILKNEIGHLKDHQEDVKIDLREIKDILLNGETKIGDNRVGVASNKATLKTLKWVVYIGLTVLGLALSAFGLVR